MTVQTFQQPDSSAQTGSSYKGNLDKSVAVMAEISRAFAPHESTPLALSVTIDAGRVLNGVTLTVKAAQVVTGFTATAADQRIDRVVLDPLTGTATRVGGSESATPAAPAIPAGKIPLCQVGPFATTTTQVTNSMITDERPSPQSSGGGFESGTRMLFQQTAAPVGWTKDTTHDNKALRIVNGTAGTGGSAAFTTAFASRTPAGTIGGTALDESQIPSHTHGAGSYAVALGISGIAGAGGEQTSSVTNGPTSVTGTSGATGGGATHSHSFTGTAMDFAVAYVDVILAQKD